MISWSLYAITSKSSTLHGVKFRGRIRLFALKNNIDVLVENATDVSNCVRFAVLNRSHAQLIRDEVHRIMPECSVDELEESIRNPVLSKLKVNDHKRYEV